MIKLKRIKLETLDDAKLNEQEMKQIVGGNSKTSIPTYTMPPFTHANDATRVTKPIYVSTFTMRHH